MKKIIARLTKMFMFIALVYLTCAVMLAICAGHYPAADDDQVNCDIKRIATDPTSDADVVLMPIQLTDDGAFVDRCQLTSALYQIRVDRAHLLVTYIHGWKHNGREGDSDREKFLEFINSVSMREKSNGSKYRRVIGLFISWNGKPTEFDAFNQVSFWDRKKAADTIAQSGIVTQIISRIASIEAQLYNKENVSVFIGHSFGARILFSATSQPIISGVQFSHPPVRPIPLGAKASSVDVDVFKSVSPYKLIEGMGGLVVLINPAFEASLFTAIDAVSRRERERFADGQPPLIVSLSSEDDAATRVAFPVGQVLALNINPLRRTTIGNYLPYLSHRLSAGSLDGPRSGRRWYDRFCADGICLSSNESTIHSSPFINARVDGSIIPSHGEIWQDQFKSWLVDFIVRADEDLQTTSVDSASISTMSY